MADVRLAIGWAPRSNDWGGLEGSIANGENSDQGRRFVRRRRECFVVMTLTPLITCSTNSSSSCAVLGARGALLWSTAFNTRTRTYRQFRAFGRLQSGTVQIPISDQERKR